MYSDRDIVNELRKLYGMAATNMYLTLLEISCDTFNAGFFEKYYGSMRAIGNLNDVETFLVALKDCDDKIQHKKGVGEKRLMF
jgi:hypothetical protein